MTMTLANLVGVDCSASCASRGTDECAFLSASEAANARTGQGCSGYRYLISVLLPEGARMMARWRCCPEVLGATNPKTTKSTLRQETFSCRTSIWKLPGMLSQ
jgi:hypothetical protein